MSRSNADQVRLNVRNRVTPNSYVLKNWPPERGLTREAKGPHSTARTVLQQPDNQWLLSRTLVQACGIPFVSAYCEMLRHTEKSRIAGWALVCTTSSAAIGGIRAFFDRGIQVGRDLALVVINDENLRRYFHPLLTCLQMPDPLPYLCLCMEWLAEPDRPWVGPFRLEPVAPCIVVGGVHRPTAPPSDVSTPITFNPESS